jgi:membrane fusion protein, copper/silver efflux system
MNRTVLPWVVATLALAAALMAGCAPETANTPKSGSAMPASVVDPYVKIASALANDSLDGVKANAGDLATASSALGAPAVKIDTSALQLASAVEIGDAREKFGVLSEALVAYVDGLHLTLPEGVRIASCPMIHKPWLQRGSEIENPYYGSSMLTCGDFR